ncbi:MAG: carboxylesterase family protein [Myxococcota bacterium]
MDVARRSLLFIVVASAACSDDPSAGTTGDSAAPDSAAPDSAADSAADSVAPDSVAPDGVGVDGDVGSACGGDVAPGPGLVVTDRGAVRGTIVDGVAAFLGVPYAAPPVGPLRWRPPEEVACWDGVRAATDWASACIQKDFELGQADAAVVGSEDCLYLNVWAPTAAAPASRGRPVMVFIHGGGNVSGAAATTTFNLKLYDGHDLAAKEDVVVVTLDYRLGPFGFLALPALSAESERHVSGNQGLLDQIAALAWVQRNIAAFGGDPDRVLLFGESAGAVDTLALLVSPLAAHLFGRALMQSGGVQAKPLAAREAEGTAYLDAVGCGDAADALACLDGLALDALVAPVTNPFSGGIAGGGGFGPSIDGWVLPEAPLDAIAAGHHNHVPFLIGANADETMITVPEGSVTPAKVTAALSAFGEPYASQLLALYPPGTTPAEARASWVRATTDGQFVCGARRIARAVRAAQSEPVWRYFFSHTAAPNAGGKNGSFHGLELFYVFGAVERLFGGAVARPSDEALSAAMMGYWARFAAGGDPNGAGAVAWPAYVGASDDTLELADPPVARAGVRTDACDVWDALSASLQP